MKKLMLTMAVVATAVGSGFVHAADSKRMMSVAGALAANDAKARLGENVTFHFAGQPAPAVLEKLAVDKTSQKTNSLGKSDDQACNWAFLSAMLRLQKRAQDLGANAVVNIVSNYKNVEMSSPSEFECHVGNLMTGVALKGEFVRIAK